MDTKEAIEFLKGRYDYKPNRNSAHNVSKYNEAIDIIIESVKQGEKYKKMWEEDAKDWLGNDLDLKEWMNDTKQKYFPKEAKQDYPESEE